MVGEFLGVSRQQAYNRKTVEKWDGCKRDGNGKVLVPSSAIKKSRDLERQRLLERVDVLDDLNSKQVMNDRMEAVKLEYDL